MKNTIASQDFLSLRLPKITNNKNYCLKSRKTYRFAGIYALLINNYNPYSKNGGFGTGPRLSTSPTDCLVIYSLHAQAATYNQQYSAIWAQYT